MIEAQNQCQFEAREISFSRDDESVFGEVSFSALGGELVVIEGTNGSGKTTLLRIMAGLMEMAEGVFLWNGESLSPTHLNQAVSIAYLGHTHGFKDELTVLENLQFSCQLAGRSPGIEIEQALNRVGLIGYDHAPARQMSAGQRKRLGLARMVLTPAPLWLLDEPYSNLDGNGIALVNELLLEHITGGGIAVTTSHGTFKPPTDALCMVKLSDQS